MQREVGVLGLPITHPGKGLKILQLCLIQEAHLEPQYCCGALWCLNFSQGPSKAYAGVGPGKN